MIHITLMRGIPGSGKSTIARLLCQLNIDVMSTDDYWYLPGPPGDGLYKFDIREITAAHIWNQKRVEDAIKRNAGNEFYLNLVVDNTNISSHAVAPYFDMAVKYNCAISILTVDTPLEECLRRNALRPKDRQVPESAIRKMHSQMGEMSADWELQKAKARVK